MQPRRNHTGLPSRMRQLNTNLLSLGVGKFHKLLESPLPLNLAIIPNPQILRRDSPLWRDGGGFYDRQSRTARDDATQVREMPWRGVPVSRGVLAERREHDAILERDAPDLDGREDLGNSGSIGLRIGGCSGGRLLGRCEVGDLIFVRGRYIV